MATTPASLKDALTIVTTTEREENEEYATTSDLDIALIVREQLHATDAEEWGIVARYSGKEIVEAYQLVLGATDGELNAAVSA
jgi:hypothetical protein